MDRQPLLLHIAVSHYPGKLTDAGALRRLLAKAGSNPGPQANLPANILNTLDFLGRRGAGLDACVKCDTTVCHTSPPGAARDPGNRGLRLDAEPAVMPQTHLCRRGPIFYWRRRVPLSLAGRLPRQFALSLKTGDARRARYAARALSAATDRMFVLMSSSPPPRPAMPRSSPA